MKRLIPLVVFVALLSCLSGYLMSKPSLIGRIGIHFFYHQYQFLRTWWKGALVVFLVLLVLLALQGLAGKKLGAGTFRLLQVTMILLALAGLYLTYSDFQHTATHRWLKEKFHLGAYLFWIGWIIISLYYLVTKRTVPTAPKNPPSLT